MAVVAGPLSQFDDRELQVLHLGLRCYERELGRPDSEFRQSVDDRERIERLLGVLDTVLGERSG